MRSRLTLVTASGLLTAAVAVAIWFTVLRDRAEDVPVGGKPGPALEIGIHTGAGDLDLEAAKRLRARVARVELEITAPISDVIAAAEKYAAEGIRIQPLASFSGRVPTSAEVARLTAWGRAVGPNAARWQGRPDLAVRNIEFGNETSYAYQGSQKLGGSYAQQAKAAALALRGTKVGLLVQADDANQVDGWIDAMFSAVPDLDEFAAGWIVHPYGNEWERRIAQTINRLTANGAAPRPLHLTEFGFASDEGRCLSDNYGWDRCMTSAQAAATLDGVVDRLIRAYPQVEQLIIYNGLDFRAPAGTSTDRENYFGALRQNRARKGRYTDTVERLVSTSRLQRSCAPGPSVFRGRWVARCRPAE